VSEPRARPWPDEIKLDLSTSVLEVKFDTGEVFKLSAEFLRVNSPSAEVRGHGERKVKALCGKRDVKITDMKQIGNYAVRLIFDDGHDTGLYSWDYLHELGRDQKKLWAMYIAKLNDEGGSRDKA
jgi:DUF971 family protein